MTEEEFHPQTDLEGGTFEGASPPAKSLEELETENQNYKGQAEKIAHAEQIEAFSDRHGQIELFLMENDLFGFEPYSPEVLGDLTTLLVDLEAGFRRRKPEYDITGEWDEKQITTYFERKYVVSTNLEDSAEAKEQNRDGYTQAVKLVRTNNPNIDNLTLCRELIANHGGDIPPEHLARLQSFAAIPDMAATPEEQVVISNKIASLDFSGGIPDPVLFVQGSIFNDPDLSEITKDAIATKLKIPRPRVVTGSQADQAMDTVDAQGQPLYTASNPLAVRDGVDAYVTPDGSRIARVEVDGIGVREIPWERGESGKVIGLKLSLIKIWAVNEAKGNTDFFGESVNIDTQILSQTDPEKLRKVQQVMEALLGGDAGYDGEIITDEQAEFIGWFNQYTATKGDAAEGDYDKTTAVENRTDLGLHTNGNASQIDYDVLRAAGSFSQGQYGSGSPDYEAMYKHIHSLF